MPRVAHPKLRTVEGVFTPTEQPAVWTLTTARRSYRVAVVSHSGLSGTEKRGVIVSADGVAGSTADYIRAHSKAGKVRVNMDGHRWDSEAEAIEAIARDLVASTERWEAQPAVSLRDLLRGRGVA